MNVYHHIRQLVVKEFFPTRYDFPGKQQKLFSFVFTMLPKHIKIKSPLNYDSVCGRVVKPSCEGLSSALSSYYRSITGSGLDGARFGLLYFAQDAQVSMRNICARFAQDCTSFPNAHICARFAQDCTSNLKW